jgi:hypothetical protein
LLLLQRPQLLLALLLYSLHLSLMLTLQNLHAIARLVLLP